MWPRHPSCCPSRGSGSQAMKNKKVSQEKKRQMAAQVPWEARVWAPYARGLGLKTHNRSRYGQPGAQANMRPQQHLRGRARSPVLEFPVCLSRKWNNTRTQPDILTPWEQGLRGLMDAAGVWQKPCLIGGKEPKGRGGS